MIEYELGSILQDFGFPAFVTAILLWDKMKTNGSLKKVVENNTRVIWKVEKFLTKYGYE